MLIPFAPVTLERERSLSCPKGKDTGCASVMFARADNVPSALMPTSWVMSKWGGGAGGVQKVRKRRCQEATYKTGQDTRMKRKSRGESHKDRPTNYSSENPGLKDPGSQLQATQHGGLPGARTHRPCHCTGCLQGWRPGWGCGAHSPLTSPGACSRTPHSGRWILHGSLCEGGDRGWLPVPALEPPAATIPREQGVAGAVSPHSP